MEQILDAPVNEKRNFRYAGFWIRVGAYVIDLILMYIVQAILAFAMISGGLGIWGLYAISLTFGIIYFAGMESSSTQGTLGKMAVRIKVGDEQGNRISFLNALGRYFAKILSGIILFIGYIMVGFDTKKQGLHDKLAGTYVFEA